LHWLLLPKRVSSESASTNPDRDLAADRDIHAPADCHGKGLVGQRLTLHSPVFLLQALA
jgi:hypothetical protein